MNGYGCVLMKVYENRAGCMGPAVHNLPTPAFYRPSLRLKSTGETAFEVKSYQVRGLGKTWTFHNKSKKPSLHKFIDDQLVIELLTRTKINTYQRKVTESCF